MKKVLLSMGALFSMASLVGQEPQVDQGSRSVFQELRALPRKAHTFAQKVLDFGKAVDYLKGARDCLSGIGCTKRKSYLANYLLGATYGFAQTAAFQAIQESDPARWANQMGVDDFGRPVLIKAGLEPKLLWLQLFVNELGYRYLVKEKVYLFRCLTFRGCTDQTKRYAFYNLGIWSGRFGAMLGILGYKGAKARQQMRYIKVKNKKAKMALELDEKKGAFLWYEILGFKKEPTNDQAKREYHKRARKYHPDKSHGDKTKEALFKKIMQALNVAKDKGQFT